MIKKNLLLIIIFGLLLFYKNELYQTFIIGSQRTGNNANPLTIIRSAKYRPPPTGPEPTRPRPPPTGPVRR
tara:strand:+ start:91 stop:303 length:213 start_codon:yes stop_codon:yes gene_type:complete